MARVEYKRHKVVVTGTDDATKQVSKNAWNDDHHQTGVIGFDDPVETLISAGVLSPTNTESMIVVGAESGTADDLDTLTVTNYEENDIVQLKATPGDTITVKHNTGNFQLFDSKDIILDENNPLFLKFDGTNWRQIELSFLSRKIDGITIAVKLF